MSTPNGSPKNGGGLGGILILVVVMALILSMCDGGSSSKSGRKWSDLSETEKANARWAYQVQQSLKGK